MPITIRTNELNARSGETGEFVGIDAVTDKTTEQRVAEITAASNAEQTKIQQKGAAVLDSLPAEYTELAGEVDGLKSAVDVVNGEVFTATSRFSITSDNISYNWYLDGTGKCINAGSNSGYRMGKYEVTPGEIIWLKAPKITGGTYQWQTSKSVPSSLPNSNLVGTPVTTAVDGLVVVPDDATWLIFTYTSETESQSGIFEYSSRIQNVHDELESYMDGFVFDVNKATADDGKNYGPTRFDFPIFRGQKITITNNQAGDNNWTCDIRDSTDADLQRISVSKGETKTAIVDVDGGVYLNVYQNVYPLVGRIVAESKVEYNYRMSGKLAGVVGDTTDIVKLNYKVPALLQSAQKPTYGQTTVPLSLLHFSDPHGGSTNVARMIEMANAIGSPLDDIICTGDMVNNTYADGFAWWGNIPGAEKILTCIGNHDVSDGTSYNKYGITTQEAYNTYFAPYIANWGVTHTGTNTYYYKDYSSKKIRLIVLDYLLEGGNATAQNTWLQSALSGAKTNGYTVVIAQHCQMSNFQSIPSNFTMVYKMTSYQYPTIYQASVQSFIDDGGEFACYIAGHTHWDMLCINPDYPDQICVCVTCTAITGRDNDQIRVGGTKSQDGANIVTIDTTSKTVKLIRVGADIDSYLRPRNVLSISYADKTLFAQN